MTRSPRSCSRSERTPTTSRSTSKGLPRSRPARIYCKASWKRRAKSRLVFQFSRFKCKMAGSGDCIQILNQRRLANCISLSWGRKAAAPRSQRSQGAEGRLCPTTMRSALARSTEDLRQVHIRSRPRTNWRTTMCAPISLRSKARKRRENSRRASENTRSRT